MVWHLVIAFLAEGIKAHSTMTTQLED